MSDDKLAEFLENGKDWEKVKTTLPGVFVLRMPSTKSREASLSVEINPVDASGSPTKRRGLIIKNVMELEEFKEILNKEKVEELLDMIGDVNPESMKSSKKSQKIIEI
jgi:hypothetical protein